jgi:aromatic-L-amino-acid decarboxylase
MPDPTGEPGASPATRRFGAAEDAANRSAYPLEPDAEQMLSEGSEVLRFVIDFITSRAAAPSNPHETTLELTHALRAAPPEAGRPLGALLDLLEPAVTHAVDTTGPGYLAYIPAGGLYAAALADLLACATNRYVGIAALAPAMVQIEASVLRWLADLFGYPASARGILTSGGSLAHFSAIVAAREARLGEQFADGTIYVSQEVHRSVAKAARLAGFPAAALRYVPCTPDLRFDVSALAALVRADRAAGRRPFLLVASAGTTNLGVVDPLEELAEIAHREGLWLHADAAYGGFFQLTERGRGRLAGIEAADSIIIDPHKGLFLPYGTGALLVREGTLLRAAHHHEGGAYLQDLDGDPAALPNFNEYSPELTREFRGLRLWLPLHLHGVAAFRTALDEKLDLAQLAYEVLQAIRAVEAPWKPHLSIVAFRPRHGGEVAGRQLLARLNGSQRVFLSSTTVGGQFLLRFAILSFRTHREQIEEALALVREGLMTS